MEVLVHSVLTSALVGASSLPGERASFTHERVGGPSCWFGVFIEDENLVNLQRFLDSPACSLFTVSIKSPPLHFLVIGRTQKPRYPYAWGSDKQCSTMSNLKMRPQNGFHSHV